MEKKRTANDARTIELLEQKLAAHAQAGATANPHVLAMRLAGDRGSRCQTGASSTHAPVALPAVLVAAPPSAKPLRVPLPAALGL